MERWVKDAAAFKSKFVLNIRTDIGNLTQTTSEAICATREMLLYHVHLARSKIFTVQTPAILQYSQNVAVAVLHPRGHTVLPV
jgi:hypothetical protein